MVISSQALKCSGKVQRLSRKGVGLYSNIIRSALHPSSTDDDIVHTIKKLVGKCNQLVVGSNPTPGANTFFVLLTEIYLVISAKNQRNSVYAEFFCWSQIDRKSRK